MVVASMCGAVGGRGQRRGLLLLFGGRACRRAACRRRAATRASSARRPLWVACFHGGRRFDGLGWTAGRVVSRCRARGLRGLVPGAVEGEGAVLRWSGEANGARRVSSSLPL